MAGPRCRHSWGRQQAPLNDTHLHFNILHDESEDLDETQLPESTKQTSAQPETAQLEVMAPQHHPSTGTSLSIYKLCIFFCYIYPLIDDICSFYEFLYAGTQQRCAVHGLSRGLILERYVHTHNEKSKVQIFRDHPIGTEASIVANEISLYM